MRAAFISPFLFKSISNFVKLSADDCLVTKDANVKSRPQIKPQPEDMEKTTYISGTSLKKQSQLLRVN